MLPEQYRGVAGSAQQNGGGAEKDPDVVEIAEVWAYLGVLIQVRNDGSTEWADGEEWVR